MEKKRTKYEYVLHAVSGFWQAQITHGYAYWQAAHKQYLACWLRAQALQEHVEEWRGAHPLHEHMDPCPDAHCVQPHEALWNAVMLAMTLPIDSFERAPVSHLEEEPRAAAPPALPVKPLATTTRHDSTTNAVPQHAKLLNIVSLSQYKPPTPAPQKKDAGLREPATRARRS